MSVTVVVDGGDNTGSGAGSGGGAAGVVALVTVFDFLNLFVCTFV